MEGTINGFIAAVDVRLSSRATSTLSSLRRLRIRRHNGSQLPRAATGGYQYYPQYSTNLDSGLSSTSKTLAREGDPARPPMSPGQVHLNIKDNDSTGFQSMHYLCISTTMGIVFVWVFLSFTSTKLRTPLEINSRALPACLARCWFYLLAGL